MVNSTMKFTIICVFLAFICSNNFCIGVNNKYRRAVTNTNVCKPKGGICQSACIEKEEKDLGTIAGCKGSCCRRYRLWESWDDPCKTLRGKCQEGTCMSRSQIYLGTIKRCNGYCCASRGFWGTHLGPWPPRKGVRQVPSQNRKRKARSSYKV